MKSLFATTILLSGGALASASALGDGLAHRAATPANCLATPAYSSCFKSVVSSNCGAIAEPTSRSQCVCSTVTAVWSCYGSYCTKDQYWTDYGNSIKGCQGPTLTVHTPVGTTAPAGSSITPGPGSSPPPTTTAPTATPAATGAAATSTSKAGSDSVPSAPHGWWLSLLALTAALAIDLPRGFW